MERLRPSINPESVTTPPKLRIGLRGVAGQLGSRICAAVNRQPDMTTTLGLDKIGQTVKTRAFGLKPANPETEFIFLDQDDPSIEQRIPTDVDVFIDATPPGVASRYAETYSAYNIPVIVQSGDRTFPHIASPPRITENTTVIRQGDCNISGLTPVLSALGEIVERVQLTVLMQYGSSLRDKPRNTRLHTIELRPSTELSEDLQQLFPDVDFVVRQITQTPGLQYYEHIIDLITTVSVDKDDIYELLNRHPRIKCMPDVRSSFPVDEGGEMLRLRGKNQPPITPLTLMTQQYDSKHIVLYVLIDSRWVTVYPNVDLARILGLGTAPLDAMKKTDKAMNFV